MYSNSEVVPNNVILGNLYVNVVVGRDLFDQLIKHYGKDGWNEYVQKLRRHAIWAMYSTPEPTEDDEHCMPVCLQMDWRGQDFKGADLSGLDLTIPQMDGCNFEEADLRGSTIASVSKSSFKRANLENTKFELADISGCDFLDAEIKTTGFKGAHYMQNRPPLNLPEERLSECSPFPAHWNSDEDATADEPRHALKCHSIELRSFWGALQ